MTMNATCSMAVLDSQCLQTKILELLRNCRIPVIVRYRTNKIFRLSEKKSGANFPFSSHLFFFTSFSSIFSLQKCPKYVRRTGLERNDKYLMYVRTYVHMPSIQWIKKGKKLQKYYSQGFLYNLSQVPRPKLNYFFVRNFPN